ncbi:UPF0481 protein At3g47200-like [Bidens hawaiensis]|uniref:UPF0481 protein At3g47200-like n=1 Tax=Bidens hawaiensis TaxID=980011 RepID=UPI00404ABCC9
MLAQQDQTQGRIEVTNDSIIDSIAASCINATATSSPSSDVKIPRVPIMVREKDDYEKYYVPKVVSIGPYHFGKPKLQSVEKLKPVFAMKLLENKETLRRLYNKLGEPQMVQDLRSYYEEDSTTMFCNKEFTKMMLLDVCFILYYIQFVYLGNPEDCGGLSNHQIVFVHQDLFLLENQIPYKVLIEVAKLLDLDKQNSISLFFYTSSFVKHWWPKRNWLTSIISHIRYPKKPKFESGNHLLEVLHRGLTEYSKAPKHRSAFRNNFMLNFRNVNELVDVGIQFKPSGSLSLSSVEFSKGWLRFSAHVKLPRITVDDSTKHMLFNMMAYEMCLNSVDHAWVTSYVCLLDSLIDRPEDVKILRKAWVLETSLGSDEEVAKLFNEIAIDLVPNNWTYLETKFKIQEHYESWSNTLFSELKNEYFKSPWAIFALLGALIALFLSGAQTYYTRWSPKGECDDLCMMLKKNPHL